jgi:hypothetical protein
MESPTSLSGTTTCISSNAMKSTTRMNALVTCGRQVRTHSAVTIPDEPNRKRIGHSGLTGRNNAVISLCFGCFDPQKRMFV